jgi:hypothetical protein
MPYTGQGMRRLLGAGLAIFALASCLSASTIDVTSQSSQVLHSGDSLDFLFSSRSYVICATEMEMSPYPGSIDFTFASAPVSAPGQFTATLESADGTVASEFPNPVSWTSGYASNSGYSGPVSAVVGSLALSNALSQALFSDSEAELVLTYTGSNVNIGVQGNTLRQDLAVSIFGGPLSIGGTVDSVALDEGGAIVRSSNEGPAVAEPNAIVLLLAGGGLCLVAGALKHFARRTIKRNVHLV